MTNTVTYIFEEIDVTVNGLDFSASGSFPVEYTIIAPDASVGLRYEGAEVERCGEISGELVDDNGDITTVTFQPGTEEHAQILLGISGDWLEEACLDDYFGR